LGHPYFFEPEQDAMVIAIATITSVVIILNFEVDCILFDYE